MPGLNGVEAALKIRELVPTCKVILFSGETGSVDLLKIAHSQGHEFELLMKPMAPDELLRRVDHYIRECAPAAEAARMIS